MSKKTTFEFQKGLIPYLTLGDPNLDVTEELIIACLKNGASAIEIGIPFSDPIADGPVIQASHQRVLQSNPEISINSAFKLIKKLKSTYSQPMAIMCAINLVYNYGPDRFFKEASTHQVDAVIIPDLSVEEADPYLKEAQENGVDLALLVSSLCTQSRLENIIKKTQGFVYLIATTGTTGARDSIESTLKKFAKKIKSIRNIPILVGFGISKAEHIKEISTFANGAIVGSHLVKIIENNHLNPKKMVEKIGQEVSKLLERN